MLVDSHCHLDLLDLSQYDDGLGQVLTNAKKNGVGHLLCVCVEIENFPKILQLAKEHTWINASVGVHPNVNKEQSYSIEQIVQLARDDEVAAIGETGLDYFRSLGDLNWQRNRFRDQVQAAIQVGKPLIIHTREAEQDTVSIMREEKASLVGGVMHCFTGSWEMAKQCLDLGFYISFSGIITFSNAKELQQLVKKIPLDRLLVETDSPYLAPVPYRGKPNQPAYVKHVAEKIAELKQIPYKAIVEQTGKNFFNLFPITRQAGS